MTSTTMAKAKKPRAGEGEGGGDDRKGRKTAPIQVEKELARMTAVIASHDGITQSELISPQIRQFLMTEYERVQHEIAQRLKKMAEEDRAGGQ